MDKKKYFIYSATLFSLVCLGYIFSIENQSPTKAEDNIVQKQLAKTKPIQIEYIEEKPKKVKETVPLDKPVPKEDIDETILDDAILEDKEITLYTSKTKQLRYIIKLRSNKIITSNNPHTRYIPLKGIIEEDNNKYKFSMSLNEHYKDGSDNDIFIDIISMGKSKTLKCDGSFLKSLEMDYFYDLKIDINDEYASCYISGQKEFQHLTKEQLPEIKEEYLPKDLIEKLKKHKLEKVKL